MIEWRECYGFPGYSVSNTGIVKSTVVSKRNPKGDMNLSLFPNSSGYPSVDLLIAPKTFKKVLVHRLVCEAFHGPRPEGAVTRHLDGCPEPTTIVKTFAGELRKKMWLT